ncbi:MAG: class I SAM-dependent methyltransferase [Anaerolineales bacterium]
MGKPVDILALKASVLEDFAAHVVRTRESRVRLYTAGATEHVRRCPICETDTADSVLRLVVHGAAYHQCPECGHCFVVNRPTQATLEQFYASDVQYAATYSDRRAAETRVQQVALPKAEWMVEEFERLYGRKPQSILDVGAGGGHFVQACRHLGFQARGIEPSAASRDFCRRYFGFELDSVNFVEAWRAYQGIDVVTFWGVIEHVPDPMSLLRAAARLLEGREGLVIAEVPRWESLSTAVQTILPDFVVRHLDPLGHIHCFTDSSIATAFERAGLAPAAAWYFGMDAYELTVQIASLLGESRVVGILGPHIPALQSTADQGRLSDEIVLAGRPAGNL